MGCSTVSRRGTIATKRDRVSLFSGARLTAGDGRYEESSAIGTGASGSDGSQRRVIAARIQRRIGRPAKIAKEAGRLHGWREVFWPRRFRAIVVSDEPEVQIARLRYLLSQGCKEGLVASPRHWPGASNTKALLTGKPIQGLWFDRTKEYNAGRKGLSVGKLDFAEPETLVLSPLPCWQKEPEFQIRTKVRALVREIEVEVDERVRETRRPPMGAQAIRQQHAHDRPAHSRRSPAPRFHAKSGEVRTALERAYQRFYWTYRGAAKQLREGLEDVVFPPGCFPPPARFVEPHPQTGFG